MEEAEEMEEVDIFVVVFVAHVLVSTIEFEMGGNESTANSTNSFDCTGTLSRRGGITQHGVIFTNTDKEVACILYLQKF